MIDSTARFSATVEDYARYRPDYPATLAEAVLAGFVVPEVVDLGAGTGIASRWLARAGASVVGVEPNPEMRARAEALGGGPRYVDGTAEATGLPDRIADVVVAAQAFHWFDLPRALAEIDRLARPGGRGAVVWNLRAEGGLMAEYDALLRRFSSEYPTIPTARTTLDRLRAARPVHEHRVTHAQHLDADGLVGRAWSSSYVRHGVADRAGLDAALRDLADRHGGRVALTYEAVALTWAAG